MPLATAAKRAPNWPAASIPAIAASAEAAENFCAKSPIVSATCLPVSVPVLRALRSASRSSGCTFALAASATCPTVARKSSSTCRRFASAVLNSLSENVLPVAARVLSAMCPASAEVRSAWSMPRSASDIARRMSAVVFSAPVAAPSVTARITSRMP